MRLGMVGLGRMGMNMARRLMQHGHQVVAYNRTPDKVDQLVAEGAEGAASLAVLVGKLQPPRIVWLMLPAGAPTEERIVELGDLLQQKDIIVEGGNSLFKDDLRRAGQLASRGIRYLDAGVSGGIWGLEVGYCTMVGGKREDFDYLEPVFRALAPPDGYLYCGPAGAGHFVKMVHNGIEYGMMQAYAEGFEMLEASPYRESLDHAAVAHLWNQGSVVRSWLLELLEEAFARDGRLEELEAHVDDSGEGRWALQQAVESGVPVPVIAASLFRRFRSRQASSFTDRVLAALRREFGGHAVRPNEPGVRDGDR